MDNRFDKSKDVTHVSINGIELIQFNNLLKYKDVITHCFTTRHGGVSQKPYESLNMAFNKRMKEKMWKKTTEGWLRRWN